MGSMEHNEWFKLTTGGASGLEASKLAQVTTSTLNRQLSKNEISPENVIAIARAYGQNPAEALSATGYLTPDEVSGVSVESLAELLSDQQLIRALAHRIDADPAAWFGTFGELADDSADELASSPKIVPEYYVPEMEVIIENPRDVRTLDYVADSSPDEPEEGDDDYHDGP